MAKVLITGANGFLGGWLTKSLVDQGHEVSVLVRRDFKSHHKGLIEHVSQFLGDIADTEAMNLAVAGQDTIFHCAGLISYKRSDRLKLDRVNVQGTANVVSACLKSRVRRLVHISSVVAIGAGFKPDQILNEDSPYNLGHLNLGYFETKRQAELIVKSSCERQLLDAVILCPSTIYGAGDAEKGSRKTQIKVAQGRFPFYTGGGVNVVAVEDVVAGILSAWKSGKSGERYILSGENMTIKTLFSKIAACAGVKPPNLKIPDWVLHGVGALGDAVQSQGIPWGSSRERAYASTLFHFFDHSKATEHLGFSPRPADQAIQSSVNWMREQGLLSSR